MDYGHPSLVSGARHGLHLVGRMMPDLNGLEATRQIRKASERTQVLIFTMHHSESLIHDVLEAGARGYLLKTDAERHIVNAVETLLRRQPYFSPRRLPVLPDTVEEVWFEVIAAVQISCRAHAGERRLASGHCDRRRRRDQHGELAEVLGGCGEMELVAGAVWSAQSQPIELQDAFQMRKQHLDLFALTARGPVHLGLGDVARHIAGALVDGARDLASGRVRTALRLE